MGERLFYNPAWDGEDVAIEKPSKSPKDKSPTNEKVTIDTKGVNL